MVTDPAPPSGPDDPPPSVLLAVRLMYVGAVLGVVAFGFELLQRQRTWQELFALSADRGIPVNQTVGIYDAMLGLGVVLGPIGAVAWIFLAAMNRRGYRWARMTGSGFLFVGVIGVLWLYDHYAALHPFALFLWTATAGVGACVVLLTWHSSAKAYYARDQRAAVAERFQAAGPSPASVDADQGTGTRRPSSTVVAADLQDARDRPNRPGDIRGR